MHKLAEKIRKKLERLTKAYERRLSSLGEYQTLSQLDRQDACRHDLELVAVCLEAEDNAPFLDYIQGKVSERVEAGFAIESLLGALMALEEVLLPLVDELEAARFLWLTFSETRNIVSRRVDEMLGESELEYRQIVERLPVGVFRTTPEGEIVEANPAFLRIFGYESLAALNQVGVQALYQDSADRERLLALLEEGPVLGFEVPMRRADGQGLIIAIDVRLIPDPVNGSLFLEGILQDITERRQAEEALRHSEERFRRMAEITQDGVTIIEEGQTVYVNDRLAEILGRSREALLQMSGLDFAAPEEKERLQAIIQDLRRRGEGLERLEYWIVRPDGERRYIRNRYSVSQEGERITGRIVFTTDLTESRQAEDALRESEELFRSVVENAQAGIFIVDDAFRFVYTNDELLRIVGYSREEVIGEDFQEFLDEESRALVADRYVRRQRGEEVPPRYEFNVVRKDGEKRRVEISSVAMQDTAGNVRTLAQLLDVTERKRTEAELEEQRTFLRQIIDLNPNLIFVKDRGSRFVLANEALARVYGTTVEDLIGKSDADFTDAEQARQFHEDDLWIMDSLQERLIPDRRLTDAEGNLRWVQAIKRPIVDEDGVARRVLGVSTDITARKELEEQIREMLERREQQVRTSTEIAQEIAAAPALDELFARVVTLIKERFGFYHAQIFRYEPDVDAVVLVTGYGEAGQALLADGHRLAMGKGVVGAAAATGQPVLATDVRQDPDWVANPHLPETRGELAVPIKWRDQVEGILDVQSDQAGALAEEDQILLEGLCGQIAIAIESTRLLQQVQEALAETEESRQALRQATELQSAIVDYADYALISTTPEGVIVTFNPAAERMLGYTAEELVGKETPALIHDGDEVVERAREFSEDLGYPIEPGFEVFVARARHDLPNQYEWTYIRKDGSRFPVLLAVTALRDAEGEITGFLGIAQDITERKRTEREMQETLRELEQLYRVMSREGWQDFERETGSVGYLFDQGDVQPAADLDLAAEQGTLKSAAGIEGPAAVVPLATRGEVFGTLGVEQGPQNPLGAEDRAFLEAIAEQVAQALESARLFDEEQRARASLDMRVNELDCLNDIGRKIDEVPPIPEFLAWITQRIPPAMQYPDLCLVAVEFEERVYGQAEALDLTRQMVQNLRIGGRRAGRLCIAYRHDRAFLDEESAMLGDIARRVSDYVENRRLFEQTEARAGELAVLSELGQVLPTCLDVDSVLVEAYQGAERLLAAANFYVTLYDAEKQEIIFPLRVLGGQIEKPYTVRPVGRGGLTEYLIDSRQPLLVQEDMAGQLAELGIARIPLSTGNLAESWLGVPITIGERVLGTMVVLSYETPGVYDEHDQELLMAIANQTALALENVRLLDQARARAEQERLTRTITDRVRRAADREAILRTAVRELGEMLGSSKTVIRLGTQQQLTGDRQPADNGDDGEATAQSQ